MSTNNQSGFAPKFRPRLTSFDYLLYAVTVFSWSASWYALKLQVGQVPVQVSLIWRFALAALIMLGWVLITRRQMSFPLKTHFKFAAMGAFLFCLNFASFYHAAPYLASGLLSVVFSLAAVFNVLIAAIFFNVRPTFNILLGTALGLAGIAMMFWPVIAGQSFDINALIGLGFCIAGTLFFCAGNLFSVSLQKAKIPIVSASFWGMTYGTLISVAIALVKGDAFIIDPTFEYLASLVFLSIVSSVLAFAAYLTLLGRIGADRAGYATVLFPVIALAVSAVLEDYFMTIIAIVGLALVLLGNIFVLGKFGKQDKQ